MKGQKPAIVWFTGLSGSGKSTVANLIEKRLTAEGRHAYILDGDNVRHGLNKDLGFTEEARVENIRRVAEVARLMADAGLIVLVSFISPFRNERRLAREIAGDIRFTEVYVDTPLEVCEARDPKGLYARARARRDQELHRHRQPVRSARARRDRAAWRDRNAREDGRGALRAASSAGARATRSEAQRPEDQLDRVADDADGEDAGEPEADEPGEPADSVWRISGSPPRGRPCRGTPSRRSRCRRG